MQRNGCRRFFMHGERLHPIWRGLIYLTAVPMVQGILLIPPVLLFILIAIISLSSGYALPLEVNGLDPTQPARWMLLVEAFPRLLVVTGIALAMGRFLDREPVETMGLSWARSGRDSLIGLALGLGMIGVIVGIKLALGWTEPVRGTRTLGGFLLDILALLPAAAAEEIAFRGYLQRVFTTWRGPTAGILITAVLFTLIHALNPNPSLLAMLNIALAGVVFGLAMEWTGTLWLATAYHFAWNMAQGPLLGMPISGIQWDGLLSLGTDGPPLLTGGPFGPEGGLLATGSLLLSLVPLWLVTRRTPTVISAYRRQRAEVETAFGPLPHLHFPLNLDNGYFNAAAQTLAKGDRAGEVVLLLRRANGDLLTHAKPFYPSDTYRLHSGGIRPGERVMAAARRETAEETGLAMQGARPLGLLTYRFRQGRKRFLFHSWLIMGEVAGEPSPQDPDEHISAYHWVSASELPNLAATLHALPPQWTGWGQFRAPAHEAAFRWLREDSL